MSHSKSQDIHVLLLNFCFSEARVWYLERAQWFETEIFIMSHTLGGRGQ